MKYNGEEVTEEFVSLVVKRIWNKCMPLVEEEQARSVLQAAEEVFAEMEFEKGNPQVLKKGDEVLHGVWPGLCGKGEVLELKPPVFELRTIVPAKAIVSWASGRIGEENPKYIKLIEKEEAQHGEG